MDIDAMNLEEIWQEIDRRANERPDLLKDLEAKYSFQITGEESGEYGLVFENSKATVMKGGIDDADCSMTMGIDVFKKLIQGNLNAASAFMTGRLKVKGNIALGLKLEQLLKKFPLE